MVDCFGLDIIYGRWLDQGNPGEDLVVCPISEFLAEIHCHGGESAVTAIARSLEAHGYRAATEEELAYIRALSPWKADVEKAIQNATTERSALLLLEMWHSIDDKIEALAQLRQTKLPSYFLLAFASSAFMIVCLLERLQRSHRPT